MYLLVLISNLDKLKCAPLRRSHFRSCTLMQDYSIYSWSERFSIFQVLNSYIHVQYMDTEYVTKISGVGLRTIFTEFTTDIIPRPRFWYTLSMATYSQSYIYNAFTKSIISTNGAMIKSLYTYFFYSWDELIPILLDLFITRPNI